MQETLGVDSGPKTHHEVIGIPTEFSQMGCRHSLNAARENRQVAKLAKFTEDQKTEILANLAQLAPWRFALGSNRKLATYTRKISNDARLAPAVLASPPCHPHIHHLMQIDVRQQR